MNLSLVLTIVAALSIFPALIIGWLLGLLIKKARVRSGRHHWMRTATVKAEYTAPGGLLPGQVGFLYDQAFGANELLATLFDLEARGKLALKPLKSSRGETDFTIQLLDKPMATDLLQFEQEVMLSVQTYAGKATWQNINADAAVWDAHVERALESDLRLQGFFKDETGEKGGILKYFFIGMIIAAIGVLLPTFLGDTSLITSNSQGDAFTELDRDIALWLLITSWLVASIAYGIAWYFGRSAFLRALDMEKGTKALRTLWPQLEGFREYLRVVEADRITFANQHDRTVALRKLLPYAVALNINTSWQKRFHNHQEHPRA